MSDPAKTSSAQEMEQAAILCIHQGRLEEAFDVCCIGLKNHPSSPILCLYFVHTVRAKKTLSFNPIVKNAVLRCFEDEGVNHQELSVLWKSLLMKDPAFEAVLQAVQEKNLTTTVWHTQQQALSDPFLIEGLRKLIITDETIEMFLTVLRRWLLLDLWPQGVLKTKHLDLICALAEQNFNNEYAFFIEPDELEWVRSLPLDNAVAIALRACYEPLHKNADVLKASAVKSFRNMTRLLITEPLREEEIKRAMTVLGGVENAVSEKVKAQYEDNPYPRWRSVDVLAAAVECPGKVLIAGCGTGRFGIQMALTFPNIECSAVDITLSSLAYAKRMSEKYGVERIHYAQCDILKLDALERKFDFINCSGVLHHMENPVEGWKKLIERLAPGGGMLIGLYSTTARKIIFDLRDYVRGQGYTVDASGLRQFRRDILNLPATHPFRRMERFKDFYSLSEVRDLIFHVQETTYTLPEIQAILDSLDLRCVLMKPPNAEVKSWFLQRFPEEKDFSSLEKWAQAEAERPHIFGEMYNFVCVRKGEAMNPVMRAIFDSGILGP